MGIRMCMSTTTMLTSTPLTITPTLFTTFYLPLYPRTSTLYSPAIEFSVRLPSLRPNLWGLKGF